MLLILASTALLVGNTPAELDFAKIPRTIRKLPELVSEEPLYGLFLFGEKGETRMWAVLDQSQPEEERYDLLYLDLDADGDLTEKGERFQLPPLDKAGELRLGQDGESFPVCRFKIGSFVQPGTKTKHTNFEIVWTPGRVSYRMNWRGEKITMGGYAPAREEYATFAPTPKTAPIYVPGYDRPFQFERWIRNDLVIGRETDFKVFVGNRGSILGTFSCVDDKFLPKGEHLLVTLIYENLEGKKRRFQSRLESRC